MRTGGRHNNCELLLRLVRDMNHLTRFVCRSVRQRGNVTGAVFTSSDLVAKRLGLLHDLVPNCRHRRAD